MVMDFLEYEDSTPRTSALQWGEDPIGSGMTPDYIPPMNLLVILIVLLLLFGGGGFYFGGPMVGGGGFGLILLVCLVLFLTGNLGRR